VVTATEPKLSTPPIRGRIKLLDGPQREFVFSEARFPALFSGVGGGKTFASIVKAFRFSSANPGALGCLAAPTYRTIEDVTLTEIYATFGAGVPEMWKFVKNEMSIQFTNGSKILLRPADEPDKLRGLNLAFFGLDEPDNRHHETFKVLQARLRQPGMPHQGWITTTPRGIRSWLYQRWVKNQLPDGKTVEKENYPIFRARTVENIHLDPEFMKSLVESYGDTKFAAQELEGEFVEFEGQAFPMFDERIHVKDPPPGTRFKREITGMDWGAIRPTAIYAVRLDTNNRIWVTDEFYERRCTERQMLDALGRFPSKVFCDPSAKDVIEMMRRNGVNARKAKSNDFRLRARLIGSRLTIVDGQPGMYLSPSCPNLIEEVASATYARQRGMDILNDKWEPGTDDHGIDGTSYAIMEIDAGPRGRPQPTMILRQWGKGYK